MRLNPAVEQASSYPFLRLAQARSGAEERGERLIDLSLGQPTDSPPPSVRRALTEGISDEALTAYPSTAGLRALRETIAAWIQRRFGAKLDPEREVLPTLGAKEPIALLARLFARADDVVVVTTPSYPVPYRSARAAGLPIASQLLSADGGWLPDPAAIPWKRAAIVWLTTPHNPTGAIAPLELLEELAERCRARGAILAVDEAYSEFWFDRQAPASALELDDRRGVIVFNSLSKRSGLAGLRSGFVAGDPEIVARIQRHRSDIGTTPPAIVQRASVAAWEDDTHVVAARARYAEKRSTLIAASRRAGLEHVGGAGGVFLWLRAPHGDDMQMFDTLLEHSLLLVPGSYLGPGGEGHLRASLTARSEQIARAADVLEAGVLVGA